MDLHENKIFIPKGNLKIPRRNMPQVERIHYGDLFKWLRGQNIAVRRIQKKANILKPIQKEINLRAVQSLVDTNDPKLHKPFLTTQDNYILDGHHRWLALLQIDPNQTITSFQINMKVKDALNILREYPRVTYKDTNNVEYNQPDNNLKLEHNTQTFRDFISEAKKVYDNPNERIQVSGFGMVRVKDVESGIEARLKEIDKFRKKRDWQSVRALLNNGVLMAFLDAQKEIEDSLE